MLESGYYTNNAQYTDRTANSDAQSATTITLVPATSVSSYSSGSGYANYTFSTAPAAVNCPSGLICTKIVGASASGVSGTFTRPLLQGITHNDVTRLQTLLASDSTVYPEGKVTGYFGPLTLKAVQKFQIKYNIAKPGVDGYGNVGPKTRAKLQEVFGK